ncbi:MAG: hypothetical protein WKF86_02170 [Acidimicrobiales bacterium]
MDPRLRRFVPWALRVTWVLLVPLTGPAFAAALSPTSELMRATTSAGLWVTWAATLLATLLLAPVTLTALRIVAPAAAVAAGWAAATGRPSTAAATTAVFATILAASFAFAPVVGHAFVNAPAYPNERRHLLRPPGALFLGPLPLAWAVAVAAPAGAVLLAAGRLWIAAAAALVLGGPAAVIASRSLHTLSSRWLVLVPAGVVVKDAMALADPVLLRRQVIQALRPAPAGTDSLDLTLGAPGLALEILLTEKVPMTLVKQKERTSEPGASARLLITPTRPGAVLANAADRSLPVG